MEDLRHGRATRERKLAVCAGGAHLAPADRAELLAVLAGDADEMVSERAQEAILSQPIESFVEAIRREHVLPTLLSYAAKHLADKPGVCDAMVQNKNCPAEYLVPVVRHLSAIGIQSLMEELDRVSESPALAAALEHSTSLTVDQKNQLHELMGSSIDEAALAEAAAEAEPDAARRQLIRDANKVVQRAVLQSPRLTEQEVEAFASMSSLTDEILRLIANNRNFRKNYSVVRNLMNNPKTPLDVSLHMLPMLNAADLKKLTTNKNVPETLRTTAFKLHRQRALFKK